MAAVREKSLLKNCNTSSTHVYTRILSQRAELLMIVHVECVGSYPFSASFYSQEKKKRYYFNKAQIWQ